MARTFPIRNSSRRVRPASARSTSPSSFGAAVRFVSHDFSYFTAINEICSSPGYVSSFVGVRSTGATCARVVRAGGISEKYCA